MFEIDALPSEFIEKAAGSNIDITGYITAVKTDISKTGEYDEEWIVLTEGSLFCVKEDFSIADEYNTGAIREFFSESLISIGLLTIKTDTGYHEVCKYTNTLIPKFSAFARAANKFLKNETVDPGDFDKSINNKCSKCGKYLPNHSMGICPGCIDRKTVFRRLLSYGGKFRKRVITISVFLLLSALFSMVAPYLTGTILIDHVLTGKDKSPVLGVNLYGAVGLIIAVIIIFRLITMFTDIVSGRITALVSGEMVFDLKTDLFESMQKLSMNFYSNKMTGNLMTRINKDTNEILFFFVDGVPFIIISLLNMIAMGSFMMTINVYLGLLCIVPLPFLYIFFRKLFPRLRKLDNNVYRRRSRMNARINDSFSGMRVIKAFGKEEDEARVFGRDSGRFSESAIRIDTFATTVFSFVNQSSFVIGTLVLVIGGLFILNGNFTVGSLLSITGYMNTIFSPMSGLANTATWASYAMNAANRAFEVIDAVPDIRNCDNPVRIPDIKGSVKLDNISFSYEINKPVLKNISIDVKSGEMIGIIGHSGSGKSTIVNLISRLYDVNEGEISIDGVPVKNIDLDDLKNQIGMVLQDTYLFIGSIAQNIAYAKPEADMEEIIKAAKIANAHDFIVKLPGGYDTIVGVGGTDLSGGEKQRFAIARAILHDPKILILDEATSSLDTETEQQIQEAMEKLIAGRTTFSIAHRLSTLRNADRLMVIDKGEMIELGTHEELFKLEGEYYKQYTMQQTALAIRGI